MVPLVPREVVGVPVNEKGVTPAVVLQRLHGVRAVGKLVIMMWASNMHVGV